jgi:hypothetical protein
MSLLSLFELIKAELVFGINNAKFRGVNKAISSVSCTAVFSAQRTMAMNNITDDSIQFNLNSTAQTRTSIHHKSIINDIKSMTQTPRLHQ